MADHDNRRERTIALSAQLSTLRQQREALDRQIDTVVAKLDSLIAGGGPRVVAPKGSKPLTARLLAALESRGEARASDLRVGFGLDEADQRSLKRVHNALRTLQRHGLAERSGRGRWRFVPREAADG